jgi:hypothetical protein
VASVREEAEDNVDSSLMPTEGQNITYSPNRRLFVYPKTDDRKNFSNKVVPGKQIDAPKKDKPSNPCRSETKAAVKVKFWSLQGKC